MKEDLVCMTNEWLCEERKQIAELKLMRSMRIYKVLADVICTISFALIVAALFTAALIPSIWMYSAAVCAVCTICVFVACGGED
jgi:hypothetical protein